MFAPVSWTESAEEHIARHQVVPHDVEEDLYGRPPVHRFRPDRQPVGVRRHRRRPAAAGRRRKAPDGGVAIVTARPMTDTEGRTFRKKGS